MALRSLRPLPSGGHLLPVASDRFQVVYSSIPGTKLTTQQRSPGRQRFDRGGSRRIVRPIEGPIAKALCSLSSDAAHAMSLTKPRLTSK